MSKAINRICHLRTCCSFIRSDDLRITCHFPLFLAHILTLAAILGLGKKNRAKTRFQRDVDQDGRVERGDLSSVVSDRAMNPHWVSLNFQSLFSENDQFCSPAKQRPERALRTNCRFDSLLRAVTSLAYLADQLWNPSPIHNVVNETRRDSHLDLECLAPALAVYSSVFVLHA